MKRLKGKTPDLAKCRTKFDVKIAKIEVKAGAAQIDCRFGNNGDGTITDYETGLQWERKNGAFGLGGLCLINDKNCVNDAYEWLEALRFVDEGPIPTCFYGHCDWRVPTIAELRTILRVPCGAAPCIDPAFGSTATNRYWSGTLNEIAKGVYRINFGDATEGIGASEEQNYIRAVRRGL